MIITLQGVESKVGTTMVAQSVAEQIAKQEGGKKILFLVLNETDGRNFSKDSCSIFLDDLLPAFEEKRLNLDDFYDGCWSSGNLVFFGGLKRRFQGRCYWPWMAQDLIGLIQDEFAHIIIDAGNHLNFGLAAPDGAPNLCDRFVVVSGQNTSALENLTDMIKYYEKYQLHPDAYLINKYDEEDIYDVAYMRKQYGIDNTDALTLPLMPYKKAIEAERVKQTFQDKAWLRGVQSLTDFLLS